MSKPLSAALAVSVLVGLLAVPSGSQAEPQDGRGDVVVVAVIDSGFNPYHWDFLGSRMPQHLNADPSDDLPLDLPPDEWIPGFPDPSTSFESYQPLNLTLAEGNPFARVSTLQAADAAEWAKFKPSSQLAPNYHYIPNTKIVGAITFGDGRWLADMDEHGVGSSSVSVGNLFGSCPECVGVMVQFNDSARAIQWAMSQPWIDAITNSYGSSLVLRDNITLSGPGLALRDAVKRGQSTFWSAGNGQANAFVVPNHTLHSAQKGPDWVVTVGAISPSGSSYSGAGKPVDIAGVGTSYPAAIGSSNVTGGGTFSGTSNATPTIAGTYSRALYLSRRALDGDSKTQQDGVIASGEPVACGSVRPDCELGDGELTSKELRAALFNASVQTPQGLNIGGVGSVTTTPEVEFAAEGHGGWFVRQQRNNIAAWLGEFSRLWQPLIGEATYPVRPEGEREWMIVDSYCRQQIWGSWDEGYYIEGETELPPDDTAWPIRTALKNACPYHPGLPFTPTVPVPPQP
ncbi:MAG: S8/S53 family peptidase [Actinomycetota bacterium]